MKCECGCGANAPFTAGVQRRFILGHNMIGPDLTGRIFGNVEVISKTEIAHKRKNWLCRCKCGKTFKRRGSVLLSRKSTGCASCNNGWKKRPFEGIYNALVASAKARGHSIELEYEEYLLFTLQPLCHYCAATLAWRPHGNQQGGHKLDRKDNVIGYSKINCVPCCPRCNWAKGDHFTYEEWKQIGEVIKTWEE